MQERTMHSRSHQLNSDKPQPGLQYSSGTKPSIVKNMCSQRFVGHGSHLRGHVDKACLETGHRECHIFQWVQSWSGNDDAICGSPTGTPFYLDLGSESSRLLLLLQAK